MVDSQGSDSFQQPVSVSQIEGMCRRAFGDQVRVAEVTELGVGTYNSTYRVDLEDLNPVILRVAPEPARQRDWDRDAMRNEYAAAPFFAVLGPLVPRILAADFTRQLINRDYMFQSLLVGVPASAALDSYSPSLRRSYYRQLGAITRAVHEVCGERFGRVADPRFAAWSEALVEQFRVLASDTEDAGVDPSEAHRVLAAVQSHQAALDEVRQPRLLHGDLWTLNILIAPGAKTPTITGVFDFDVASWGDPQADWTIHRVRQRSGTEADAFWETYGPPPTDSASAVRELFYRARHLIGVRLDIHRRDIDINTVPPVHWDLSDVLTRLDA
jgi:aminoglycoside phosphotransferase (APT) family kinase protein